MNWQNDGEEIIEWCTYLNTINTPGGIAVGREFYFQSGISWNMVSSSINFSARYYPKGHIFNMASNSLFVEDDKVLFFVALLNTKLASNILNMLNPTVNFSSGVVGKLPIVYQRNNLISDLAQENIEISKHDWDSREVSWDFQISPLLNDSKFLKSAFQKWKKNEFDNFFKIHLNEEKLNRIFIDIYGLQDELTSEVALKDITILQDELKKNDLETLEEKFRTQGKDAIELPINRGEVISQFISYAFGLFMGRYRLDKSGINVAHPNPTEEELASYEYNHGEVIIDQDAILPLMGKNCNFNDDVVKQFTQLLDTIWGHEQRTENINFIQECLDKELEKFLVNDFWNYHCGMYKKTPIYWLFSSKKGAFQVLVYMHRMNEFTVEKIRANYLLEHLKYLKSEIAQKEANARNLSTAESKQLDKLRADLIECEQYDMALKNVADQQIKFDLDDGVVKNYELFETVVAKIK